MRSFPRARDTAATAPRAPAGPGGAGRLAPSHSERAGGPAKRESRGTALVRWAALALLLAVAGQAAAYWPLAASAPQAMPPWCAAAPAALTDIAQPQRAAPATQAAEPLAQAGFGWG